MPIKLRQALQETYAGWKDDLTPAWRNALSDVELAFAKVDNSLELELWEPIFPARKGRRILGAPFGAATLSAFAKLTPNSVRAVLIGQDPYPSVAQATGRSFEQGNVDNWVQDSHDVTESMRRILQVTGDFRSGTTDYTQQDTLGWDKLIEDLAAGTIEIENRAALFDKWAGQGVLLLNAGLTITRFKKGGDPHQLNGHIPLWAPVIDGVMRFLAARKTGQVVFLLWGGKAFEVFRDAGVEQAAKDAGTWQTRVRIVRRGHPAFVTPNGGVPFFQGKNAFAEPNEELVSMGANPIDW